MRSRTAFVVLLASSWIVAACRTETEPQGSRCGWDEASDFRDPTAAQLSTIRRVEERLSRELSLKEQGYLVALRFEAIPPEVLRLDPVLRKATAIARTEAAACRVSASSKSALTGQSTQALGGYCEKFFSENLGECWAVEPADCNGHTLCCVSWALTVAAGFGCDPAPSMNSSPGPVESTDSPVDPEAYDAAPQNLECDPPCRGAKICVANACVCPQSSPFECPSGCTSRFEDSYNCGQCGTTCALAQRCQGAECVPIASGGGGGTGGGAGGSAGGGGGGDSQVGGGTGGGNTGGGGGAVCGREGERCCEPGDPDFVMNLPDGGHEVSDCRQGLRCEPQADDGGSASRCVTRCGGPGEPCCDPALATLPRVPFGDLLGLRSVEGGCDLAQGYDSTCVLSPQADAGADWRAGTCMACGHLDEPCCPLSQYRDGPLQGMVEGRCGAATSVGLRATCALQTDGSYRCQRTGSVGTRCSANEDFYGPPEGPIPSAWVFGCYDFNSNYTENRAMCENGNCVACGMAGQPCCAIAASGVTYDERPIVGAPFPFPATFPGTYRVKVSESIAHYRCWAGRCSTALPGASASPTPGTCE